MLDIQIPTTGTLSGLMLVDDINTGFSSLQQNIAGILTKSVAGGVDVTLTDAESYNGIISLTGVITADINVIVPAAAMRWTIVNNTTGSFTLTVKTSAGTGITVGQGLAALLFCNGTNVVSSTSSGGSGTFTSLSNSGNLTFTGTGNRITGDFSNATVANRVAFQTSTTNGYTAIVVIPNGTSNITDLELYSGTTVNESLGQLAVVGGNDVRVNSNKIGTGTYLPMTFYTGGSERARIDTSGNVGIGTANPQYKLNVAEADISNIVGGSAAAINITNTNAVALGRTVDLNFTVGTGVASAKIAGLSAVYTNFTSSVAGALTFLTNNGSGSYAERMRITSTGAIQDGSGSPLLISGKETIWIPAGAMTPRITGAEGATFTTTQLVTNGTLISSLAFDSVSIEYAQFQVRMPKSWNESTITYTPVWTANSVSTAGVAWVLRAKGLGNDETIDAAWGTGVTVTDLNTATAYQAHIASESTAVTISNAAELEWVVFEVYRDVGNVSDTLAADALLLGITINYTTNAANDA